MILDGKLENTDLYFFLLYIINHLNDSYLWKQVHQINILMNNFVNSFKEILIQLLNKNI